MKISINRFLLVILMFTLVILGEGLTLRSYSLYVVCSLIILNNLFIMKEFGGKMRFSAELVVLLLFLLYSVASYAWAMNSDLVLYRAKVLSFLTILVFFMTNQLYRTGRYRDVIVLYFFMGVLLALACIVYFGVSGIISLIITGTRLGEDEALFMGINANTIALDCATAGIIGLAIALFRKKKVYLLSLIPTLIVVVATGSRKGIFMLLVGIVLILYFYQLYTGIDKYSSALKILMVIIVLIGIASFVLQLPGLEKINEQYMGLINSFIGKKEEVDISTVVRGRMVDLGWRQFQETPILGIGLDNGKVINAKYNNFSAYLHNNYIEVLVNGGVIGFALYYSFFALLLIKHIKRWKERNLIVYISSTLLVVRLICDWGRVSYFDYMNIILYSLWIIVANKWDNGRKSIKGGILV